MASIVDLSLELAAQNVRLFPVIPNSKKPAVSRFSERATSDRGILEHLFDSNRNSGIACGKYAEDLYLVGFDIDCKTGKPGFETLAKMEVLGQTFPETWAQRTPSGGEHRLFWSPVPIRQGVDVCGPGIDLRGEGGYLVGPGSVIDGKTYEPLNHNKIARFPAWAVEKYRESAKVVELRPQAPNHINPIAALVRCVEYLQSLPAVSQGQRNHEGYKVVCRLKDLGADQSQVVDLLHTYWKCAPMLEDEELNHLTNSAFKYGENPPGVATPERAFEKIPREEKPKEKKERHPFDVLNDEHFFMATEAGSRIGWETRDEHGDFKIQFMPMHSFHDKFSWWKIVRDEKPFPVTKLWIQSKERRTYDSFCFDPSGKAPKRLYNMWRGFTVEPARRLEDGTAEARRGLEMFLEHCLKNVCHDDAGLNKWLLGFFAHIFQRPTDRPRVSLVFKGQKGAGKNALAECVGHLLGDAFVNISDQKRVFSKFNSVLEAKLLVVLDEAFFSGDKSVDGILKSMITEETRLFERKGLETYSSKVFDRIIIIGNEDRLVNATGDERRYAVFSVGNGRLKDWRFFKEMKEILRSPAGAALLLRYFLDYDLTGIHLDDVPQTAALDEQKQHSIGPFETWWHQCLCDGRVLGHVDQTSWPETLLSSDLRAAFLRWVEAERVRGYIPVHSVCGKIFARIAKGSAKRRNIKQDGTLLKAYALLPLDIARMDWDQYIGFKSEWDEE